MLLKKLLKDISPTIPYEIENLEISNLALHSDLVKQGGLFMALKGFTTDGRLFIEEAVKNGAIAIIAEKNNLCEPISYIGKLPIIYLKNLTSLVSKIADNFYHHPSQKMKIIGITGTDGKSSCCHYITQSLNLLGHRVAISSTLGVGIWPKLKITTMQTTPDPIQIQANLYNFYVKQKAKITTMEISSHALDQDRESAVSFDYVLFTNLTREHLDYHKSMENYAQAKYKIFIKKDLQCGIINSDDYWGQRWLKDLKDKLKIYTFGLQKNSDSKKSNFITAKDISYSDFKIRGRLITPRGDGIFTSSLIGCFNLYNILATAALLIAWGYTSTEIIPLIERLKPISGRMQTFKLTNGPLIIIDYAHTPNALQKVLMTMREYRRSKLIIVFGCGGNRDRGKRKMMGKIADNLADKIILTDCNLRFEDGNKIIDDILEGISNRKKLDIEHDRTLAIKMAIKNASNHDIILITGRGHENYRIIGNSYIPADTDLEIVQMINKKCN